MNFKNRGGASFFKFLLMDDSIDRLPLPPAYAKKHLETGDIKKQTIVLKIKSGAKWSVKYSKIKDQYYFMDGWLKFMKDNNLQMGVFLVFWSLSGSPTPVFQVSVYEPNGCLKQTTLEYVAGASSRKTQAPFVKEEITSDDDSLGNVQQKMTRVFGKSYSCTMPMKNSFVKATGIDGYRSVQLRNDEGMTWDVKLMSYMHGPHQITKMGSGWCNFRKHNKIEIGNICEFYHVKWNLLHVGVLTAE